MTQFCTGKVAVLVADVDMTDVVAQVLRTVAGGPEEAVSARPDRGY